jgi:hypothetical protein
VGGGHFTRWVVASGVSVLCIGALDGGRGGGGGRHICRWSIIPSVSLSVRCPCLSVVESVPGPYTRCAHVSACPAVEEGVICELCHPHPTYSVQRESLLCAPAPASPRMQWSMRNECSRGVQCAELASLAKDHPMKSKHSEKKDWIDEYCKRWESV